MKNRKQTTSKILMIRPASFGANPETAINNTFQAKSADAHVQSIRQKAREEFDQMVIQLQETGVDVNVVEDSQIPEKPDAVFPNNWITTHADGSVITYPMFSELRRLERREDVVSMLEEKYRVEKRYSFEQYEEEGKFLEGTGSLVLDRVHRIAYACLSPRTDIGLLDKFGVLKGYRIVHFTARANGTDIYHTNVLMAMGHDFVIICREAIPEETDWVKLHDMFAKTAKEVIEISADQMHAFAGNMIELRSSKGEPLIVMSEQALQALSKNQKDKISKHGRIVAVGIPTIEKYGGGSARCMIAEIFLPPRN